MLSARELNSASLPNRTWVNERLTFTHGYGLTLGPVNQVTSEGLPVLFVRNLPPETIAGSDDRRAEPLLRRALERLRHRPHAHARSSTTRAATRTCSRSTTGTGGVPLGSLWRKLLFALRFGAYQIVLSDDIDAESRILFNRNIRERVRTLAPFLALRSAIRIWCSPTAGCTGCTTPTRRAAAIRTRRRPAAA